MRLPILLSLLLGLVLGLSLPSLGQSQLRPRRLAPGVLTTIPPQPHPEETFNGPLPLRELLAGDPALDYAPNYGPKSETVFERAQEVTLRHKVWSLEFSFKPLRLMAVPVPQPDGTVREKLIWYLVYRVRNNWAYAQEEMNKAETPEEKQMVYMPHLAPVAAPEEEYDRGRFPNAVRSPELYTAVPEAMAATFTPHFVMEAVYYDKQKELAFLRDLNSRLPADQRKTAADLSVAELAPFYVRKAYLDRVIPTARLPIQQKEDPAIKLLDSAEMATVELQPTNDPRENTIWGVATWEDVDPRVDYASVYVQGLTNAFQFKPLPEGGYAYIQKTLQLNFWRPGDSVEEHEGEIRFGVRIVEKPEEQRLIYAFHRIDDRLDYRWLYR